MFLITGRPVDRSLLLRRRAHGHGNAPGGPSATPPHPRHPRQ